MNRSFLFAPVVVVACLLLADCGGGGESGSGRSANTPDDAFLEFRPPNSGVGPAEQVQDDVRSIYDALYSGDANVSLSLTHTLIIDMLGGPQSAKSAMAMAQEKAAGIKVQTFNFPSPPMFVTTAKHEFVVVPTLQVVTYEDVRAESLNYQFGARKIGQTHFRYIEGSRVNQSNVRDLFPDFPTDFVFPKFHRKRI